MKNVCFVGVFNKMDLILYIAKVLKSFNKRVLIVDATILQKTRYIIPKISNEKSYITNYDNIDIAIGFKNYLEIEQYVKINDANMLDYDIALIDVDKPEEFINFNNEETIKNYFVTSFDAYSIRRGLQTLIGLTKPIQITKVFFASEINKENEHYFEYLALGKKVNWEEKIINFEYAIENIENAMENEKNSKIKLRNLTSGYKESLAYIISDILTETNESYVKKVIKNIEKEG